VRKGRWLQVRVDEQLYADLHALAENDDRSLSSVVRKILREWLAKSEKKE
jgi:hypothetical protein